MSGIVAPTLVARRLQLPFDFTLEPLGGGIYYLVMPLTLDQLAEEAMNLPPASRAELAEKLVGSLDFSEADEMETRWATEAVRRRDEVRSGQVRPIPGEEVIAEVRRIVGR